MSANNLVTINKKTFVVENVGAETGFGNIVGKGKSLEEAIGIAEKEIEDEEVEYGIRFVTK